MSKAVARAAFQKASPFPRFGKPYGGSRAWVGLGTAVDYPSWLQALGLLIEVIGAVLLAKGAGHITRQVS